jgi:riboflavin biosynthesis pyrimidine reductase
LQPKNQLAKQFALDPLQMIEEIATNFNSGQTSPIRILVEAGPKLLLQITNQGLVDHLYLTVNTQLTGENPISITELTSSFELLNSEDVMPCQFRYYKKLAK